MKEQQIKLKEILEKQTLFKHFKDNKLFLNLIIAISVASIATIFLYGGFFQTWQTSLSDVLYSEKQPLEDIVIIGIDDKSLQEIGRWPWDRERFTEMIDKLNSSNVIGIDIAFFEDFDGVKDIKLAESIKRNGNVVLAVEYIDFEIENKKSVAKNILKPIDSLLNSTDFLGYVNIVTDRDGVTRNLLLDINGSEKYNSFASEIYSKYLGRDFSYTKNKLLINFIGKPKTFKTYSFTDVLNNRVNLEEFNNKIVLIGATSPDLHDDFIVPTSSGMRMPGVEVHASALQTMLTKNFIHNQSHLGIILIIFLLATIISLILFKFRLLISSIISFTILILYMIFSIIIFNEGVIMNLVYPTLTIIGTYGIIIIFYYLSEEKNKKWITSAFGRYISKDLLKEIIENKKELKLGGEKRTITIFFSDIRGFTSISESLPPEDLVNLLNDYLTEMTQIILENKGTVDKFIGDAVMAFWNAPLTEKDHAKLACKSAIEQIKKLKDLQKKWKKEGKPSIKIGCGIHTGEAIVGNMGSEDRFDYTAMGDTINLGSRLESLTKQYGVSIIVSRSTYKTVKNNFKLRKLDAVKVKGKKVPVTIYELVVDYNKKFCEQYEKALELYFKAKFKEALKEFKTAEKIKKGDKSCELFVERCKEYIKNPPKKDWDGSFEMKTK